MIVDFIYWIIGGGTITKRNMQFIKKTATVGFIVLTAFLGVMICSKTSFLYPVQDWVDPNCFFTTAKSMANGSVLYRDIFEQKGILLYALHIIGYYISNTSFLGVFFIQAAWFSGFLLIAYKTARLYLDRLYSLVILPLLSLLLLTSNGYSSGDSAEEFCLPFLAFGLYVLLKHLADRQCNAIPLHTMFICGILAGCVLWIKYTILGFWIGFILAVIIIYLRQKMNTELLKGLIIFCLGGALVSAFCLLYFISNNAVGDLFEIYFELNIFGYSPNSASSNIFLKAGNIIAQAAIGMFYSLIVALVSVIGILFFVLKKSSLIRNATLRHCLIMVFSVMLLFMYIGGNAWPYYYYCASCFAVLGLIAIARIISNHVIIRSSATATKAALCPTMLAVCIFLTFLLSPNSSQIGLAPEKTTQHIIGTEICKKRNSTLLNYGCLDGGFYTVTNKLPVTKYFCKLNIPYESYPYLMDEHNRIVKNAEVDFVVINTTADEFPSADEIPYLLANYDPVKSCTTEENYTGNYALYQKK